MGKLRKFTQARIALGRTGTSVPLSRELLFKLAHAHARDAVHSALDIELLLPLLKKFDLPVLELHSQAASRYEYLQRPDLGRLPDAQSSTIINEFSSPSKICIVIADGLSAVAINNHIITLLNELIPLLKDLSITPLVIVQQARVAIADHIAYAMKAELSIILIGERPGLTATDSIGAYITFDPKPGLTDEMRNCISNIRPGGLTFNDAALKISYLVHEAFRLRLTGVNLKDNHDHERTLGEEDIPG